MTSFHFRSAHLDDLKHLIELLNQDHLGKTRESLNESVYEKYQTALTEIVDNDCFDILIMENADKKIIGCAQIMCLPHLSFKGSTRMQIESLRIEKDHRGKGLGKLLIKRCIELAKQNHCKIIQFTANNTREDANRLYVKLGFKPTHIGYKMYL